jgi:hypothetical protein
MNSPGSARSEEELTRATDTGARRMMGSSTSVARRSNP